MAKMLIYENIVALNREQHRDLKLDREKGDATFASKTHYTPIAGSEFEHAARNYPILFTGEGDNTGPIVLFSLTEGYNPFVDTDKKWRAGTYVPAFIRRYPLILARGDNDGDDYTVCIDETFTGLDREKGDPLFDEEGNESELLRESIAFLNRYRTDMESTARFMKKLEEFELLVPHDLQLKHPDGRSYALKDFRFVDVDRLNRLSDSEIGKLQREGYLAWIYAHRISLANLAHLETASEAESQGKGDGEAKSRARAKAKSKKEDA